MMALELISSATGVTQKTLIKGAALVAGVAVSLSSLKVSGFLPSCDVVALLVRLVDLVDHGVTVWKTWPWPVQALSYVIVGGYAVRPMAKSYLIAVGEISEARIIWKRRSQERYEPRPAWSVEVG